MSVLSFVELWKWKVDYRHAVTGELVTDDVSRFILYDEAVRHADALRRAGLRAEVVQRGQDE